jgi:hypothetical protein
LKESHCPVCYSELLVKKVTPCSECGADDFELDHYKEHNYHEYIICHDLRLVLCDFCDVDFGSYDATYFGFEKGRRIGYEDFKLVREVTEIKMVHGKYCPDCNYTLPFLKFVRDCRIANEKV